MEKSYKMQQIFCSFLEESEPRKMASEINWQLKVRLHSLIITTFGFIKSIVYTKKKSKIIMLLPTQPTF